MAASDRYHCGTSLEFLSSPPRPIDKPLEFVFSFDTTGSLSGTLNEVRKNMCAIVKRLSTDIPKIRFSIIAHGDYGDTYVTKIQDFSSDPNQLASFINASGDTHGGDFEECYELVLREVRTKLSWTPGTNRRLIMIGDSIPHAIGEARNIHNIDWREEARRLVNEMDVSIYAVQAYENTAATPFWKELAGLTPNGGYLVLENIESITSCFLAIVYDADGPEYLAAYEDEIEKMPNSSTVKFDTMKMMKSLKADSDGRKPMAKSKRDDLARIVESIPNPDDELTDKEREFWKGIGLEIRTIHNRIGSARPRP